MSTKSTTSRNCTWDDYRSWNDGKRWEIIDGEAFAMTPAPTTRHQQIQRELTFELVGFFREHPCDVFPAPTDVKLSDLHVVQPDIVVVCNPDQIKRTHIEGAPALVIEILSPSTETFDRVRKMRLYAHSGIREVWLITPYPWLAEVYALDGETYRLANSYERDDTLVSVVFPGLKVALSTIFNYPIDPSEHIEMVKEGCPPYGASEGGE